MTAAAILQMTSGIDPEANAAVLVDAVRAAAAAGAVMLFTPEMCGLLDRDRARAATRVTDEAGDAVLAAVREAAADTGLWVHLGSLAVRHPEGRLANRGFVIDGTGAIRARYDKLHLFDVDLPGGESWRESAAYRPGDAAVVLATPIGRLGLSICYDLRFPALYAALAAAGAEVIAVPAAFTRPTGRSHWEVLLRARAIETGSFVIAAAQTGRHQDGRETWGHALAIDPWGTVVADLGEAPGLSLVPIDRSLGEEAAQRIPVRTHARAIPRVTVA